MMRGTTSIKVSQDCLTLYMKVLCDLETPVCTNRHHVTWIFSNAAMKASHLSRNIHSFSTVKAKSADKTFIEHCWCQLRASPKSATLCPTPPPPPQIKGGSVLADTNGGDWWGLWNHHTRYRTDLRLGSYLIYSMEQSPSWGTSKFAANQKIPSILWNLKVHYAFTRVSRLSLSWARSIQPMSSMPLLEAPF